MTRLSLYLVTLLLGSHFPGPTLPPSAQPAIVSRVQMSYEEQRMVDLANEDRRSAGLPLLRINPMLTQIARQHSREMYELNYFDHHSPNPELETPMARYLNKLGHMPSYACVGENLFYSSVVDPDLGNKCLMESAPHRANMLSKQFDQIGVGVYESSDGRFWVTQMFLKQVD